ncbi:MAG: hypothetical protein IT436_15885, partial [Phycisphaerales bacterium]|nr:hypothetical protein [Phycisphaerales bacterium]
MIDKDVPAHPMSLLEDWKEKAEKQAEDAAFGNLGTKTIVLELSEEDRDFLRSFALQQDESVDAVWPRLVEAARTDIRAFMGTPKWPVHAIQLGLTLQGEDGEVATTLAGLGQGVFTSGSITLVSPPGTGKSTTLIQLAAAVLEEGKRLAAYIPLNEWKPGVDWFKMLLERNAFRSFKPQHFMQLAYEGRLVMLFDGWNELAADASISAHTRVEALLRDYPQLGIVIGTRQQALSVQGTLVRLEPLDQEQQLELARAIRGRDGEALVEQAWTIPGVRDLVTIPLYLDALMCCVSGAVLPDTKDAVLDNFVRQHESDQAKAVLFRTELQGVHRKLLTDLANTATSMRTTTLVDEQARASIGRSVTQLQGNHQLTVPLQPGTVLDKLVDTHLLTRTSAGDSVSFQHQQFQEWFASFHVERLMLAAVNDAGGRNHLRNDILNWPSWEESVLFACERLSRKGGGVAAVAQAIIDTLGIDPMLAAEMIYRSSSDVWVIVRDQVIAFADRWHTVGEVDRAVRFMALTGKSDFADRIWPLL